MNNPFVFPVADLVHGGSTMPEQRRQVGPSPSRIGPEMIAIAEGEEVVVDATLTPLGGGILVDADVTATLTGECVRCLRTLRPEATVHISQMYAVDPDFITGDEDEEDGGGDAVPLIERDEIDIEQAVIDEAGLTLPFNPTCEGGCPEDDETDVPKPDGVVDADGNIVEGEDPRVDPRWAGLEKFL